MATATLRLSTPVTAVRPATSGKSLFKRFLDALIEARMRAALRELAMHRHLIPQDVLKEAGYSVTAADDHALPFTR